MTTLTNKEIDATVYNLIQELINDGFKIDSTKTQCLYFNNKGDYKMTVTLCDKSNIIAEVVEQVTTDNYYTNACIKYGSAIIHSIFNTFFHAYDDFYSDSKDEAIMLREQHNKDVGNKTLDDIIKFPKYKFFDVNNLTNKVNNNNKNTEDKVNCKSKESTPKYDSLNDYIKTATFCKPANLNDFINALFGGK